MLELTYPWLLLTLPLPLLVYLLVPAHRERKSSVQVPFFNRLVELTGAKPSSGAVILKRLKVQQQMVRLSHTTAMTSASTLK